MRPLKESDLVFVEHYLRTGDATGAYHAAGYNGNSAGSNAFKMLRRKNIQEEIQRIRGKALAKVQRKVNVTVEKVLNDLEDARKGAMIFGQFNAAIHASELHGRHIGMWREDAHDREQAPRFVINNIIEGADGKKVVTRIEPAPSVPKALPVPPQEVEGHVPDYPVEELTDDDLIRE